MDVKFEIIKKDVLGRVGHLKTKHGIIETPMILPVINPNNIVIPPEDMKNIGAEAIITNSYIIYSNQRLRDRAREEGLHRMLNFDRPIMTDSGSFQLSVYGDINVDNMEILQFQNEIGSDICVPLDIPTKPNERYDEAEKDVTITINRLREISNIKHIFKDNIIVAPIQGSTYRDLRRKNAIEASKLDFDLYAIGAIVPLLEEYRYDDIVDVVIASKLNIPLNKPVHLFGAGHPMGFAIFVLMGCDLFDSASYILYAMDKRYLTVNGTYKLSNLRYFQCNCPVCSKYTPEEVRGLENEDIVRLLAIHNLYESFTEIKRIKQSIMDGRLWELVQIRCASHPKLLNGLRRLVKYSNNLERYDVSSKSAFFYGGAESNRRTEVIRYRKKLRNMPIKMTPALITTIPSIEDIKDYKSVYYLKPPFGPYPLELSETYPLNFESPEILDKEMVRTALLNLIVFLNNDKNKGKDVTFEYDKRYRDPLIKKIKKMVDVRLINEI
ncbi:tRNA guanosine(15) transglycosylase TgtA [Candidatus Methanoliparum sp. LAM-1]|uniref:tRNA guanosine(15) transglycosylase TgtA n=1 Tax=Candidatus Methanoliparum sp. LAM-1 TaxID=2874846 RepID=UPI001E5197AF|nr:tRNA guanosine(15) transglycosylase TgtA [Candidatus Methanoliparum sp. LAM-1]BDC36110.1 tRNA-guanine(15) transglycosylase [Candidatus Methanoliparum sp. LAM-1]